MSEILTWFDGLPTTTFDPGEPMVREGTRSGKLIVLVDGEVEVARRGANIIHTDEPGAIFGEMSVLLDMPHSAMVTAVTPVRAFVVENAIAFLRGRPELSLHVAKLLARRLYYTTSYLADVRQAENEQVEPDFIERVFGKLFQFSGDAGRSGKSRH